MRVPMRGTGADHPVVAMKDGNASGAKGVDYPALPDLKVNHFMGGACEEGKAV